MKFLILDFESHSINSVTWYDMYAHFWKCGISGHYTQFYLGPCWRLVVALNQSNWTCPDGPWKMIFATHSWVHTSEIVWPTFLFVSRFLRFFFQSQQLGWRRSLTRLSNRLIRIFPTVPPKTWSRVVSIWKILCIAKVQFLLEHTWKNWSTQKFACLKNRL